MFVAFFNQTFVSGDLAIIGLLILLEGVLSIDNAMVLGLLAKRLPEHKQKRALFYGLLGAFVFRILASCTGGVSAALVVGEDAGGSVSGLHCD